MQTEYQQMFLLQRTSLQQCLHHVMSCLLGFIFIDEGFGIGTRELTYWRGRNLYHAAAGEPQLAASREAAGRG